MSKPATIPTWATTGGTRVVPTAGKAAAGYAVGERPSHGILNYLIGILCDWVTYLTGALPTMFGGSAFQPITADAANFTRASGDAFWSWTGTLGAAKTLTGHAPIPVGATITRAIWYYNRASAGTMNFTLHADNPVSGDSAIYTLADAAGTVWQSTDSGAISYTVVTGDAITITVDGNNDAHRFLGVELHWTLS